MTKRIFSILLCICMVLQYVPVSAFAATTESAGVPAESAYMIKTVKSAPDIGLPENDELFTIYAEQKIYGYDQSAFGISAGEQLAGDELAVYNALVPYIKQIAAGERASAVIGLGQTLENVIINGTPASYIADTALTFSGADFTNEQLNSVLSALMADYPYEMYWYDKVSGTMIEMICGATVVHLRVHMSVAANYGTAAYTADTVKTGAASTVVSNANAVVAANAGLSDYEKLVAYKNWICDNVSYNDAAADDNTTPYGDPWQLIYVFDGDSSTNVVCEGYAKAFQYLCDLGGLDCICVSGYMAGATGAGPHMWNVVTLEGKNYLVDVTNCDEGTVGYSDLLFLVAADYVDGTYTFDCNGTNVVFSSEDLGLATTDYEVSSTYTVTVIATENGTAAADKTTAAEGETIILTLTPAAGYELESVTVKQGETEVAVEGNTFIMPTGNVVVIASFKVHSHHYENGVCVLCSADHPSLEKYDSKVISILGDSISTFAGYIPVADGFNLEHLARYPQDNLLTEVDETWWMQVITALDAKLGINDSWRGATVSGAAPVTSGTTGENASMANLTRIQNLGSNGTPDVILFYGGTNDLAHVSKVGTFNPNTAPTEVDLTTTKWDNLADGYVHTLLRLKHFYPEAQIVALLPTYTASYYSDEKLAQANELLTAICAHYGVACVDLRQCGISVEDLPDGIHPDATGMDYITEAVLEVLLEDGKAEAGEHVVHSVTHNLTNAKASRHYYRGVSAGRGFTEVITGRSVTVKVTMDGVDITQNCYDDGVISIDNVTGDLVIVAQGERIQTLPAAYYDLNLWPLLEHDPDYYSATGWTVHSSGRVTSVTIPVQAGERLWASSFDAGTSNGSGGTDGIRVTWFDADGNANSVSAGKVYEEFAQKGYLTVPNNAVAVCVPMWVEEAAELYIFACNHSYVNNTCTVCGAMDPEAIIGTALESFEYTLDETGKVVTLTKYIGSDTAVEIPNVYTVDGKVYAVVLDSATVFRGNTTINSVLMDDAVRFRNNSMAYLFAECSKLTDIRMPDLDTSDVTDMSYLFFKCTGLTELDVSDLDTENVTTMRSMFSYCTKLKKLTGYETWNTGNVLDMYQTFNRVFSGSNSSGTLETAVIDISAWDLDQVKNTGWCFQLCYANEICLPDNLAVISAGFFNHTAKITGSTYTIPKGVKKIGYAHTIYDFATNDFVEFVVADGNTNYKTVDGILYSMDGTEMLAIPRNKPFEDGIYEIPEGVTFLGELSFSRNYNIQKLILPDSYVIEQNVEVYDEDYIIFEDKGNLNNGNSLSIAIYCYTGITEYAVKDTNTRYTSVDGIIYSKDMTQVVAIPTRYAKVIEIPEGVTTWNKQAMWDDKEVADQYAMTTVVDQLLGACGGVSIPSTLVSIEEEQLGMLNRLVYKYGDSFVITVSPENPVYYVDGDGYLKTRISLAEAIVIAQIPDDGYSYDGVAKEPEVTATLNGTLLTKGTDYAVSYSNNINAGTATVTVTGIGAYTGSASTTFVIAAATTKWTANAQVGSSLALYLAFNIEGLSDITGHYAVITRTYADGSENDVVTVESSQWKTMSMAGEAYYYVKYGGLAAKEMTDIIYIQIFDANGVAVTELHSDSLQAYAMRKLEGQTTKTDNTTIYAQMLVYGAAAQSYFGYNVENLADAEMTALQKSFAMEDIAYNTTDNAVVGMNYGASNLQLQNTIKLYLKFNNIENAAYATITFINHNNKTVSVTVDKSEFTFSGTAIVIDELVAADYNVKVTCTVYDSNDTVLAYATDSVENYIGRNYHKNALYGELLKYMMAAYNFFH